MKRHILLLAAAATLALVALPLQADQSIVIPFHTWMVTGDCPQGTCQFPYSTFLHSAPGGLPDGFMNPGFDDSLWVLGRTPFGDSWQSYCVVTDADPHTTWPLYGDVLVRAKFPLCVGATSVEVRGIVDNSIAVWMNGHALVPRGGYESCEVFDSHSPDGILCDFENCAEEHVAIYDVDTSYLYYDGTPNVLAVQGCDHGVMSYLDFEVLADRTNEVCDDPCEHVSVSATELWPPNHKFTPVSVTVGEGEEATLATIISVMQDEPTSAPGDKCPDATISSDGLAALLRVERLGGADGRIYHLGYEATVGGFNCTGTIGVCVPHDQGLEPNCVDGGSLFDSTVCN